MEKIETNVNYGIAKCPNCGSTHSKVGSSGLASCCGRRVRPPKGITQQQYNQFIHGGGQANYELQEKIEREARRGR